MATSPSVPHGSPSSPPPAEERRAHRGFPWAVGLGSAYLSGVILMAIFLGPGSERADNEWVLFLGRFHFLFLHVPIGLLLLVFAIEAMAVVFRAARPARAGTSFALWFAGLGAVGATLCGYLLSLSGGYGEELLDRHLWSGIAVAIGTLLTLVAKLRFDGKGTTAAGAVYGILLTATVGVLMAASHFGGSLTHGSDYLTKYMPSSLRALVGMPIEPGNAPVGAPDTPLDATVVFAGLLAPILEDRCHECHNVDKDKGDYRMDEFALLVQGGETGPGVVPGDLDGSELYYRLVTDDEDERMPPEGKKAMSEEEIRLVAWWIESGASESATFAELAPSEEIRRLAESVRRRASKSPGGRPGDPGKAPEAPEEPAPRKAAVDEAGSAGLAVAESAVAAGPHAGERKLVAPADGRP